MLITNKLNRTLQKPIGKTLYSTTGKSSGEDHRRWELKRYYLVHCVVKTGKRAKTEKTVTYDQIQGIEKKGGHR
jgi:hypothetical protein